MVPKGNVHKYIGVGMGRGEINGGNILRVPK